MDTKRRNLTLILACLCVSGATGCHDDTTLNTSVHWNDCVGMEGQTFCRDNNIVVCNDKGVVLSEDSCDAGTICVTDNNQAECVLENSIGENKCGDTVLKCRNNSVYTCANGNWHKTTDCNSKQICNSRTGECDDKMEPFTPCKDSDNRCVDGKVVVCDHDTLIASESACPSGQCEGTACKIIECENDDTKCEVANGNVTVSKCVDGKWTPSNEVCGACTADAKACAECDDNDTKCEQTPDNAIISGCTGGRWTPKNEPCATCAANGEVCAVCENDAIRCEPNADKTGVALSVCEGGLWKDIDEDCTGKVCGLDSKSCVENVCEYTLADGNVVTIPDGQQICDKGDNDNESIIVSCSNLTATKSDPCAIGVCTVDASDNSASCVPRTCDVNGVVADHETTVCKDNLKFTCEDGVLVGTTSQAANVGDACGDGYVCADGETECRQGNDCDAAGLDHLEKACDEDRNVVQCIDGKVETIETCAPTDATSPTLCSSQMKCEAPGVDDCTFDTTNVADDAFVCDGNVLRQCLDKELQVGSACSDGTPVCDVNQCRAYNKCKVDDSTQVDHTAVTCLPDKPQKATCNDGVLEEFASDAAGACVAHQLCIIDANDGSAKCVCDADNHWTEDNGACVCETGWTGDGACDCDLSTNYYDVPTKDCHVRCTKDVCEDTPTGSTLTKCDLSTGRTSTETSSFSCVPSESGDPNDPSTEVGECFIGAHQCASNTQPQVCNSSAKWENLSACSTSIVNAHVTCDAAAESSNFCVTACDNNYHFEQNNTACIENCTESVCDGTNFKECQPDGSFKVIPAPESNPNAVCVDKNNDPTGGGTDPGWHDEFKCTKSDVSKCGTVPANSTGWSCSDAGECIITACDNGYSVNGASTACECPSDSKVVDASNMCINKCTDADNTCNPDSVNGGIVVTTCLETGLIKTENLSDVSCNPTGTGAGECLNGTDAAPNYQCSSEGVRQLCVDGSWSNAACDAPSDSHKKAVCDASSTGYCKEVCTDDWTGTDGNCDVATTTNDDYCTADVCVEGSTSIKYCDTDHKVWGETEACSYDGLGGSATCSNGACGIICNADAHFELNVNKTACACAEEYWLVDSKCEKITCEKGTKLNSTKDGCECEIEGFSCDGKNLIECVNNSIKPNIKIENCAVACSNNDTYTEAFCGCTWKDQTIKDGDRVCDADTSGDILVCDSTNGMVTQIDCLGTCSSDGTNLSCGSAESLCKDDVLNYAGSNNETLEKDCAEDNKHCSDALKTCVECTSNAHCASSANGAYCDTSVGACVECLDNNGCASNASNKVCDTVVNKCVECLANDECASNDSNKVCDSNANKCVECVESNDCDGTNVCDTSNNTCVACLEDDDCPGGSYAATCSNHQCVYDHACDDTVKDGGVYCGTTGTTTGDQDDYLYKCSNGKIVIDTCDAGCESGSTECNQGCIYDSDTPANNYSCSSTGNLLICTETEIIATQTCPEGCKDGQCLYTDCSQAATGGVCAGTEVCIDDKCFDEDERLDKNETQTFSASGIECNSTNACIRALTENNIYIYPQSRQGLINSVNVDSNRRHDSIIYIDNWSNYVYKRYIEFHTDMAVKATTLAFTFTYTTSGVIYGIEPDRAKIEVYDGQGGPVIGTTGEFALNTYSLSTHTITKEITFNPGPVEITSLNVRLSFFYSDKTLLDATGAVTVYDEFEIKVVE